MSGRPDFKGDYMGFSFGTRIDDTGAEVPMHSSYLGIVRVSEGSRFNENLLPTIQDKTVQVPGGDGTYYFGSYYTQRQFNLSFAFDSLTEQQVAELKAHFGDKKIHDLIFDEAPYKAYSAKVTGTATIKYIPFKEGGTNRLYKGEGTIQFTCYQPSARNVYKWLDKYDNANKEEWKMASRMKQSQSGFDDYHDDIFNLFNAGDIETNFILKLWFNKDEKQNLIIPEGGISINNLPEFQLNWESMPCQGNDVMVCINSRLNIIEGYEENIVGNNKVLVRSGNVYNKHINDGNFFKLPLGESTLVCDSLGGCSPEIEYNYYYF